MDAYFLVHFKSNYPTSKLKVQEVIQQKNLEYGVRVKDKQLAECFREKRYTQEFDLYEHAEIFLQQSLSVSTSYCFIVFMVKKGMVRNAYVSLVWLINSYYKKLSHS